MYEEIIKYLLDKAAPATASEIVSRVLKIEGSDPQIAEKILSPIIKDAEEIYYTRNGLIELKQGGKNPGDKAEHYIFCKILPATSRSVTQWHSIQLLIYRNNREIDRYKKFGNTPVAELNSNQLTVHFEQIENFIKDSPLVFDGFGNQISLFRSSMLKLTGKVLTNPVISLYRVAKRIFPDIKIQDPARLSALLGGRVYKDADSEIQMNMLIEQFFSLQQLCLDKDVNSLLEMLEFQEINKIQANFQGYAFDEAFLQNIPASPGVYVMRNKSDRVIYVGKSKNLYNRLNSYFAGLEKLDEKLEKIRSEIHDIDIFLTGSELEALLLEQELIDEYKPSINRQLLVHERIKKGRYIYKRILFLPAATTEIIKLYLIDPKKGLSCLEMNFDCSNIGEIKEKTALFFDSDKKAYQDKRLDIIASWLYHNEDHVNSIDMRKYADLDKVIQLIKDYAKSLANDFSRVIQY